MTFNRTHSVASDGWNENQSALNYTLILCVCALGAQMPITQITVEVLARARLIESRRHMICLCCGVCHEHFTLFVVFLSRNSGDFHHYLQPKSPSISATSLLSRRIATQLNIIELG